MLTIIIHDTIGDVVDIEEGDEVVIVTILNCNLTMQKTILMKREKKDQN